MLAAFAPQGISMAATSQRLGLPALTALVVGSMVGAGIFSLPQNVARSAGPAAAFVNTRRPPRRRSLHPNNVPYASVRRSPREPGSCSRSRAAASWSAEGS